MVIVASTRAIYLGNKMLLYANMIASAIEHSYELKNPSFGTYAHNFENTADDFHSRYPVKKSWIKGPLWLRELNYTLVYYWVRLLLKLRINNRLFGVLDIGWEQEQNLSDPVFLEKVKNTRFLYLQGWQYRGSELLARHAKEIRKYFIPIKEYRENVANLMNGIRKQGEVVIGMHLRQGDFKGFLEGKYFYESIEYVKIMEKVLKLFPTKKIHFLICSNVEQDAAIFEKFDWTPGTGQFIEDMYSFVECDYLLGPPSTYTMWASFCGEVPLLQIENKEMPITLEQFKISSID